ncbi:MAG: glutamate-1-semialdehyde 2,1-aminomutase [Candidatus Syntropharchaeia archaeon]
MKKSEKLFKRAKELLPGGVSSPVRAIDPFPFYTESARGSKIRDVDGREYIDYCMAYGPLILGHAHPSVANAVREQLEKGWIYGTPVEKEIELAEKIIRYYPGIEMLRFVNTGTEATMGALRVARGFTGRNKFIKIEGGFHGAHDSVLVKAGSGATTLGTPNSLGVPEDFTKNTLQIPFNDIEALSEVVRKYRGEIGAIILEPVLGNVGPILPEDGYLREVRRITEEEGIVLIFDEVITGFRLGMGGAQERFGIVPDITVLGKIIGGGFPIGIFGGKKEIMELISPSGKVYQAGTFNGNPFSLTAGIAVVKVLERDNVHEKLEKKGEELRKALWDIIKDKDLGYSVGGIASMFKVFFGNLPRNYQEALKCDKDGYLSFFKRMLDSGIFLPPSQFETNFISIAHSDEDIERTIEAYSENLK